MADDVGRIVYVVDIQTGRLVRGIRDVNGEFHRLDQAMNRTDRGTRSLSDSIRMANRSFGGIGSAIKGVIAPLISVAAALGALRKLVDVQRQFDVLNAGLITATGSAQNAAIAFDALQQFAAKTPYDLNQATKAFTQLVNLGLTPSEQALMSYGNTASALGKDLSQMVEAVADATTGEFERLKEFGIKAKQEGDRVSLTFQGVTTKIGNNAAEIEKYLIALGENQFAGAMEQRMATLDGAISNLGDTWDNTFRLIAASGAGDIIETAVRMATDSLQELNDQLASGELGANIDAVAGKFDGIGRDIDQTFDILTSLISDSTGRWSTLLENNVNNMIATFKNFPENVRAFIQIMTVEVLAGFDKVKAYARAFNDGINAIFTSDTFAAVGARLEAELSGVESVRSDMIGSIIQERDTALDSFDKQTAAADELRKTYDELNKAKGGQGDRLAGFKVGGSTTSGPTAEEQKAQQKALDEQRKGYQENLKTVQQLQEALVQAGMAGTELAQRQAELSLNQYATPEQIKLVRELAAALQEKNQVEENKKLLASVDPLANEQQRFQTELANLRLLNEAKLIEDQRYLDLKTQAETAHIEQMRVLREQDFAAQSATNQLLIDSLNQLQQGATDAFVGLLSGAENGREAVQQLAQAILKDAIGSLVKMGIEQAKLFIMGQAQQATSAATAAGTGAAMAASYAPAAAAASVASFGGAAGAGLAALASAVPAAIGLFSGRALGGPVQANGMYRVNETGSPEIFNAANGRQYMMPNQRGEVVSNKDASSGGGSNVVVNITNNTGAPVAKNESEIDGKRIIDIVVGDMMQDGKIGQATNRITGTTRAGR